MLGRIRTGDPRLRRIESVLAQELDGLVPANLIGDTVYSDGSYRKDLKEHGTELIVSPRTATPRTRALCPKSMFHYDREQNTLTCPPA